MAEFLGMAGGEDDQLEHQLTKENQQSMSGGRRRRGSRRSRRGRKGRGGYLVDVLGATALLGATQFAKGRANYGYTGRNNYGSRKRRSSRRSRRSRRSSSRR